MPAASTPTVASFSARSSFVSSARTSLKSSTTSSARTSSSSPADSGTACRLYVPSSPKSASGSPSRLRGRSSWRADATSADSRVSTGSGAPGNADASGAPVTLPGTRERSAWLTPLMRPSAVSARTPVGMWSSIFRVWSWSAASWAACRRLSRSATARRRASTTYTAKVTRKNATSPPAPSSRTTNDCSCERSASVDTSVATAQWLPPRMRMGV
ncbi:hypothetical protein COSO111634_25065 [Corallococcus soli]